MTISRPAASRTRAAQTGANEMGNVRAPRQDLRGLRRPERSGNLEGLHSLSHC